VLEMLENIWKTLPESQKLPSRLDDLSLSCLGHRMKAPKHSGLSELMVESSVETILRPEGIIVIAIMYHD